ncbi:hypothetical protein BDZ91DRAFT_715701 [Kalaharituber pfeilii]|nr:hypothetical protein BDZ91DRAFT_715701 [Kalaharituber pfeilii]
MRRVALRQRTGPVKFHSRQQRRGTKQQSSFFFFPALLLLGIAGIRPAKLSHPARAARANVDAD